MIFMIQLVACGQGSRVCLLAGWGFVFGKGFVWYAGCFTRRQPGVRLPRNPEFHGAGNRPAVR